MMDNPLMTGLEKARALVGIQYRQPINSFEATRDILSRVPNTLASTKSVDYGKKYAPLHAMDHPQPAVDIFKYRDEKKAHSREVLYWKEILEESKKKLYDLS